MLLLIAIVMLGVLIAISLILLSSNATHYDTKLSTYATNKNITGIAGSTSEAVTNTLSPISANMSLAVENLKSQVSTINSDVSTGISSGLQQINKNISSLSNSQAQNFSKIKTELATNNDVQGIPENITKLIHLDSRLINITENISVNSISYIPIYPTSQSSSGGYVFGSLLPGFDNHILINATEPVIFAIFGYSFFNTINNQVEYTPWCSVQIGSSTGNGINLWWNYTQQSNENFIYVIYNTTSGFNIGSNTVAIYNRTLITREAC